MNVLDAYDCDYDLLNSLFERQVVVGDRVDLPDGVYANTDDELVAIVFRGRFIAELEVFNSYGETRT